VQAAQVGHIDIGLRATDVFSFLPSALHASDSTFNEPLPFHSRQGCTNGYHYIYERAAGIEIRFLIAPPVNTIFRKTLQVVERGQRPQRA
jgi:hypothetical protein